MSRPEVAVLQEDDNNAFVVRVRRARERFREIFRAQVKHLQKLEQTLKEFRDEYAQLESEAAHQFDALEKFGHPSPPVALDAVLASVHKLSTATLPKHVFNTLTDEASRMGVRAVAFEVRGNAAWVAAASGFGPQLTEQALHSMVVPLSVDTPFRRVIETGRDFQGNSDALKRNRNLLNRLSPAPDDSILLLPIRSGGAVSAVFYADSGGNGPLLPESALKLLAEFAGAQLDRLMVAGDGSPKTVRQDVVTGAGTAMAPDGESAAEVAGPLPVPVMETQEAVGAAATRAAGAEFGVSQLGEAEQQMHKDAKRLARLLVSEIELYNRAKVADGRKNKDLYKRMKLDIDRSRQTFEQRYGKTFGKQFDYFHEELVRTLAGNDPSLLGSDYPGNSI